ncbi:MAG: acyl carrier protein, partial [Candidatus Latescibacterota bacterium]
MSAATGTGRIEARIRRVVVKALELAVSPEELPDSEPLFGGGLGGDSIGALEVVFGLEREFGIEVGDDELRPELFDSVASLVRYVDDKLA